MYSLPYEYQQLRQSNDDVSMADTSPKPMNALSTYQPMFRLKLRQDIYDKKKVPIKVAPKRVVPLPKFTFMGGYGNTAIIEIRNKTEYQKLGSLFGPKNNQVTLIKINHENNTITVKHSDNEHIIEKTKAH